MLPKRPSLMPFQPTTKLVLSLLSVATISLRAAEPVSPNNSANLDARRDVASRSGFLTDTNRARGSIRSLGEETKDIYNPITKKPETVHTYGWYLRKYISDARAKGMTPVLCTPVPHCPKAAVTAGDVEKSIYVEMSTAVATKENVPLINLNQISMSHYAGLTPDEIKAKYFTTADNTHSSPAGAELNAASVIEGLRALTKCPLKNYLLPPQP